MASAEIELGRHKFLVNSDLDQVHLDRVASLVQTKITTLLESSAVDETKAAVLAAVEFASQGLRAEEKVETYRGQILKKASSILERLENEISVDNP